MKKVLLSSLSMIVVACISSIAIAEEGGAHGKGHKDMGGHQMKEAPKADTAKAAPSGGEQLVDAGNKTCPITGQPVNGKDFVTYKGKRYGLCCKGCDVEFLKDPEKYIKKLKERGEI